MPQIQRSISSYVVPAAAGVVLLAGSVGLGAIGTVQGQAANDYAGAKSSLSHALDANRIAMRSYSSAQAALATLTTTEAELVASLGPALDPASTTTFAGVVKLHAPAATASISPAVATTYPDPSNTAGYRSTAASFERDRQTIAKATAAADAATRALTADISTAAEAGSALIARMPATAAAVVAGYPLADGTSQAVFGKATTGSYVFSAGPGVTWATAVDYQDTILRAYQSAIGGLAAAQASGQAAVDAAAAAETAAANAKKHSSRSGSSISLGRPPPVQYAAGHTPYTNSNYQPGCTGVYWETRFFIEDSVTLLSYDFPFTYTTGSSAYGIIFTIYNCS
ncbi:MAG: hypothetical protein JWO10_141 [Microbacteriaceae bacterium]|nr:hypothetical protein [Microbacteriaceae bacterium]